MHNAESIAKRLENAKSFMVATLPLIVTRIRNGAERDAVTLTSYVFAVRPIVEAIEMIAEDQGFTLEHPFDEAKLSGMNIPVIDSGELDGFVEKINLSIAFVRDPFLYDVREEFRSASRQGLIKAIYLLTSVVEGLTTK